MKRLVEEVEKDEQVELFVEEIRRQHNEGVKHGPVRFKSILDLAEARGFAAPTPAPGHSAEAGTLAAELHKEIEDEIKSIRTHIMYGGSQIVRMLRGLSAKAAALAASGTGEGWKRLYDQSPPDKQYVEIRGHAVSAGDAQLTDVLIDKWRLLPNPDGEGGLPIQPASGTGEGWRPILECPPPRDASIIVLHRNYDVSKRYAGSALEDDVATGYAKWWMPLPPQPTNAKQEK
jgi:hypothetical protein